MSKPSKQPQTKSQTKAERHHELELETLRFQAKSTLADRVYRLVKYAFGCFVVCVCARYAYLSVEALAGKQTSSLISIVGDLSLDRWAAYAVAAICGVGWRREHKLRRKTIEDIGPHVKELEGQHAPERPSSGLLPDGRPKHKEPNA